MPVANPESPVLSPCIGVCTMAADDGYCIGCRRTLDEIAHWSGWPERKRRYFMEDVLPQRGQERSRGRH